MSATNSVQAPAPGVALGVVLSLVPAAVVIMLALFLNWGRS